MTFVSEGMDQVYMMRVNRYEGKEDTLIALPEKRVYYSGDVVIPEKLQIGKKELKITGISSDAFRWSDSLSSIYIPATLDRFY